MVNKKINEYKDRPIPEPEPCPDCPPLREEINSLKDKLNQI